MIGPQISTHDSVNALQDVSIKIEKKIAELGKSLDITLVAVSKAFNAQKIMPILEVGHRVFGENRVQEAKAKWPMLRQTFSDIELHLIGPLQSNKAAEAVQLFDVIETVDREKIAMVLAQEMKKYDKHLRLYVQVNTGSELQKAGIPPQDTIAFVKRCQTFHHLNIEGLMCIPPTDENPGLHFALLEKLGREAGLSKFSMGMSKDFETAIAFGSTNIRIGSAIFGCRSAMT
ncbi:MAG: Alanine racemase domain-containing protein [Candidatus Tokpelaia sp. JSC188]|nr:MAG: Alanine racemase domain-containing protein [Candidatus Tokpelaia sp. JSC188]